METVSHTGVQGGVDVDVLGGVSNCGCHWVGATLTSGDLAADVLYSWQLLAGANLSTRLTSANRGADEVCSARCEETLLVCTDEMVFF